MSRIGKAPIEIPEGVKVTLDGKMVSVKGPRGELSQEVPPGISVEVADDQVVVTRASEQKRHRALHGLTRALLANVVRGVNEGFEKRLELQGVGYRAQMEGKNLRLYVGLSHDVVVEPPEGVELATEGTNLIIVQGIDKQQVGQMAATIRAVRPVSVYWAKGSRWRGIKYTDEQLRRKAGKQAKIGAE
jgi:large subunit ribosomal protein L6